MRNNKRYSKQAFNNEIKYCIYKQKYDIALSKIDEFLRYYPNDIYALTYKATVYRKQNNYDKSLQTLESIISNPTIDKEIIVVPMKEYARTLFELRRNDEALHYYMKVIEDSNDTEVEARKMAARIYKINHDLKSAVDVLTVRPDNVYLSVKRSCLYYDFRQWSMLKRELDRIKRKNIKDDNLRQEYDFLYGSYYFNSGNFEDARKHFTNAINLKNTYYFFEANIKLSIIDLIYDDVASSIIRAKSIVNDKDIHYSSRNSAIITISNAYLKIGNYEEAKKTLDMLEGQYTRKKLETGKLYLYSNNYEKAEQVLEEFVDECDFEHYDALFYLALTKFRLGKYEEAYKIADTVLKVADTTKNELYKTKINLKRLKLYVDLIHYTPIRKNKKEYSYMEQQIISYSKDKAIKHANNHHRGNNKQGCFDENFRVDEMIDTISNLLDEKKKISDEFLDRYIIDYNTIGFNADNNNSILVLTLPDTKQIVNMYVLNINQNNSSQQELQPKKIKRMSQIEKFNRKYNKIQK